MRPIQKLELVLTDTAKSDLRAIGKFIAKDNPKAASDFMLELVNKLFSLAENGVTGPSRDHVRKNFRGFPYRNRCFYFWSIDNQMVVVRILDGHQDIASQDFPTTYS
ncbi:type II toxin-antitoxin system RelE/ParE family toxin [Aliikangiella coralliicola]|uniref:Type II toxin-antitoxin system RelE/ParE family toxin n=1 Tax=Aliikangiella coralliicola TaxID=2592383 RepID=A0A545UGS3_9GAMM|nr:type II toxin-antitoxin system RelE/ParE family toxin [Aliikangiella coralliicola]